MRCIKCGGDTKVTDKRENLENATRRRRECLKCKLRFTTYEKIIEPKEKVLKEDIPKEKILKPIIQKVKKIKKVKPQTKKIKEVKKIKQKKRPLPEELEDIKFDDLEDEEFDYDEMEEM